MWYSVAKWVFMVVVTGYCNIGIACEAEEDFEETVRLYCYHDDKQPTFEDLKSGFQEQAMPLWLCLNEIQDTYGQIGSILCELHEGIIGIEDGVDEYDLSGLEKINKYNEQVTFMGYHPLRPKIDRLQSLVRLHLTPTIVREFAFAYVNRNCLGIDDLDPNHSVENSLVNCEKLTLATTALQMSSGQQEGYCLALESLGRVFGVQFEGAHNEPFAHLVHEVNEDNPIMDETKNSLRILLTMVNQSLKDDLCAHERMILAKKFNCLRDNLFQLNAIGNAYSFSTVNIRCLLGTSIDTIQNATVAFVNIDIVMSIIDPQYNSVEFMPNI